MVHFWSASNEALQIETSWITHIISVSFKLTEFKEKMLGHFIERQKIVYIKPEQNFPAPSTENAEPKNSTECSNLRSSLLCIDEKA